MLRRAVSFFLAQYYPDKELIVLNNHPIPIQCSLPGVQIINEPKYDTVGECRNRLLELAHGEFIRTWDDDDGYLPWSLSQGMAEIGDAPAFKPEHSWYYTPTELKLVNNALEASMLVRTEVARKYGYSPTAGDEHAPLLHGIVQEGGCKIKDVGEEASYIYHWGWGSWHLSGSLGNGSVKERSQTWKEHNTDAGDGELTKISLDEYYTEFSRRLASR